MLQVAGDGYKSDSSGCKERDKLVSWLVSVTL